MNAILYNFVDEILFLTPKAKFQLDFGPLVVEALSIDINFDGMLVYNFPDTLFQKSTGNFVILKGWRWFRVIWNGFFHFNISLPVAVSFRMLTEFSINFNK